MIKHAWSSLLIPSNELRLDMTLLCGQTFVWQRLIQKEYTSYFGVVENTVVELKESKDDVEFRQIQFDKTTLAPETLRTNLHKLFNYDARFNLPKMHAHFAKCDPKFYARVYTYYPGVRVIQQEPLECLISFICSSNNNVARITLMITRLCAKYGSLIGTLDEEGNTLSFFKFPTLDQLSTATEEELKGLGFGYRAKFVVNTVAMLIKKQKTLGNDYLLSLRSETDRNKVIDALTEFNGVGCKVAACAALYSLDKFDCVPGDVHILRLARLHYNSIVKSEDDKELLDTDGKGTMNTDKMKKLMQMFVNIFGENAGWAQMILYGCQVAAFRSRMPEELKSELFETEKKKKVTKTVKKTKIVKQEVTTQVFIGERVTRSRTRQLTEIYTSDEEPSKVPKIE